MAALLWPDSDEERSRRNVTQAVFDIRHDLGEHAVISRGEELILDPVIVGSDVDDFEAAIQDGRYDQAIDLYRGPFLHDFTAIRSVDFEQWVDQERTRLARLYKKALVARAEAIEATGDRDAAVAAWLKAANAERFDSRIALRYLLALDAAGDRAGALKFADRHAQLMEAEFGTGPDPEFLAAVEEVRNRKERPPAVSAPPGPARSPSGAANDPPADGRAATAAPNDGAVRGGDPAPAPATVPGSPDHPGPPLTDRPTAVPKPGTAWRGVLIVAMLLVVAVLTGYLWNVITAPRQIRVAVLPFTSDSADVAFAHGLSEHIMDRLASGCRVSVPAWSAVVSLRGTEGREAASRLKLDRVVEGRVHRQGDSLRVLVNLSEADGDLLWTGSYDRADEEVFATWNAIANAVSDEMRVELAGCAAVADQGGGTTDVEALDAFMKGRHMFFKRTPDGLRQALHYYGAALQHDQRYARAHAGIADAYNIMGAYDYGVLPPDSAFPVALEQARRALELAPNLGEANAALANALFAYNRDWEAADSLYRRAIELYPHYPEAHHWYSLFLLARGDAKASMESANRALQLDSLSPIMRTSIARHRHFRGDFEGAVTAYRRALRVEPGFLTAYHGAGLALLELGRYDEAIELFERALELIGRPFPTTMALIAHAHGRAGRPDTARSILAQLRAAEDTVWVAPEYFALVHLGLGDEEAAMDRFEEAIRARSSAAPYLGIDPIARPLWDQPRFRELVRRGLQTVPTAPTRSSSRN